MNILIINLTTPCNVINIINRETVALDDVLPHFIFLTDTISLYKISELFIYGVYFFLNSNLYINFKFIILLFLLLNTRL